MNSNEITTPQRVKLSFPTLITNCIGNYFAKKFGTTVDQLTKKLNTGIEKGVRTPGPASDLESNVKKARGMLKAGDAIRMEFTRPLDTAKTKCISDQRAYLKPLQDSTDIADRLCINRSAEIKEAERQARLEAIRKQEEADAAARAREAKNQKISIAKGGTGDVKPVVAPVIAMPVSLAAATNTTAIKYRVSDQMIEDAIEEGVREIPGVHIYQVWKFDITDRKKVPQEYKEPGR